jgi:hypothetical protein
MLETPREDPDRRSREELEETQPPSGDAHDTGYDEAGGDRVSPETETEPSEPATPPHVRHLPEDMPPDGE